MINNLDFKYIAAKNFLCFGPEGIEIDLKKFGNIIVIEGKNFDDVNNDGRPGSNGSGKTSIIDIITYTLFGKTLKRPKKITHRDVINNKTGKGLCTEVVFDNYKVIRSRKPDKLELFEEVSGEWIKKELGGMPDTQKEIERIVGLTYETFINVMFFDDTNSYSFLESDTPTKRKIVENLMSLERYRGFSKRASELVKEANNRIKFIAKEYEHLLMEVEAYENRVTEMESQENKWLKEKENELSFLEKTLENLSKELASTNVGELLIEYDKVQEEIVVLSKELSDSEKKYLDLQKIVEDAREKRNKISQDYNSTLIEAQQIKSEVDSHNKKIKELEDDIEDLNNLEIGVTCKSCYGLIDSKNKTHAEADYKEKIEAEIQKINSKKEPLKDKIEKAKKYKTNIENIENVIKKGDQTLDALNAKIKNTREKINEKSKVEKPEVGIQEKILEERIVETKKQIEKKKEEKSGPSPYIEIIKSATKEASSKKKECNKKKKEIEKAKKELPYYKFWTEAFGDNGIRKFVIDGIIPALNERISYWMQFLIDNKIQMVFNNQLEETIERNPANGDPFIYYAMSGGERRRLNLAVSQAFAHIMMLSSGSSPSLVFLDEVTSNIDENGVEGIYSMILELSKDRQIFVTTHDQHLQQLLSGCEILKLHKRDGFTTIAV